MQLRRNAKIEPARILFARLDALFPAHIQKYAQRDLTFLA
jgi:hypothetical protein